MNVGDRTLPLGWRVAVVSLAALLPALPRLFSPSFCLDDAFIHLAYVKSLHLGDGLSYNPGDFETGASSPLWVFTLALWPAVSPPVWAVKLMSSACHLGTALVCMALAARLVAPARTKAARLWTGLAVASVPLLVQGAVSGMGVCLAALLLSATTYATFASAEPNTEPGTTRPGTAFFARPGTAAMLAGLAYLARPEALSFCGLLSALALLRSRGTARMAALAPGAGALVAALLWSGYLYAVSGYPLPNTYYVKGDGLHWDSLGYLVTDLLPLQPALVSLTGPLAVALALRALDDTTRKRLLDLGLVCLGSLIAIAVTRKLRHGTLFFHSRHAMPVMWIPALLVGIGLAHARGRARLWLGLPFVLVTIATLAVNNDLIARQERGVQRVHVDVAAYVNQHLPSDAVLAVEGAGALRYLTPRSMRIVDLMGLNTGAIAHAPPMTAAKLCYATLHGATHIAYPSVWHEAISSFVSLQVMAAFEEPAYAQTLPPEPYTVLVARIAGQHDDFVAPCAHLASQLGWLR